MLKSKIKLEYLVLILSFVNLILYHLPVYKFTIQNLNSSGLDWLFTIVSIIVLIISLNALVFYIIFFLSNYIGKLLIILFFNMSSISVYFINTYGVIIDKTMIGNILNTNFDESSSFFSLNFIIYIIFLGIVPSMLILKIRILHVKFKSFIKKIIFSIIFILSLVYINSSNWLWIDNNSKSLGGLVMPWSYVINTSRFYIHKSQENKKQILLPNATIKNKKKSVVVLVIGESARSQNFSLYGYDKLTNPLLSRIKNIYNYKTNSCATYTTAGVKCILEHKKSRKLYEILPNYLFRNDVEVIWRTTNWGEPNVLIENYQNKEYLKKECKGEGCGYDEVLLSKLNDEILKSKKEKILIVLHTSTSHGPTYYKKYPERFNKFKPVCKSVELGKCTQEELINAYDNTILYTDYILSNLIQNLKQLKDFNSTMLFISDHGESLGEKNLYMHGIPASIAPKEQLEIPFIVWHSDNFKELKKNEFLSQHNVFHSVLDFLAIDSPIYDPEMSIFKND